MQTYKFWKVQIPNKITNNEKEGANLIRLDQYLILIKITVMELTNHSRVTEIIKDSNVIYSQIWVQSHHAHL